jgi:hypothetical protein
MRKGGADKSKDERPLAATGSKSRIYSSSYPMAIGLSSLPTELICHILLFLTPKDLCRFAIVCSFPVFHVSEIREADFWVTLDLQKFLGCSSKVGSHPIQA